MNPKIHLKSALFGLIIGAIAILAIGAETSSPRPIGRYQVECSADNLLLVDTATGQVWAMRGAGVATLQTAPGSAPGFFDAKTDR